MSSALNAGAFLWGYPRPPHKQPCLLHGRPSCLFPTSLCAVLVLPLCTHPPPSFSPPPLLCHTHTQLFHIQHCHIQLCRTHTQSFVTHNFFYWLFRVQDCHTHTTLSHTQLCNTHVFQTQVFQTQLCHTQLRSTDLFGTHICHTHTHTLNSFTYNAVSHHSSTPNSVTYTNLLHASLSRTALVTRSVFHHFLCISWYLVEAVDMWGYLILYNFQLPEVTGISFNRHLLSMQCNSSDQLCQLHV